MKHLVTFSVLRLIFMWGLAGLAGLCGAVAQAQERGKNGQSYTYAEGSSAQAQAQAPGQRWSYAQDAPQYYRGTHGDGQRVALYRHDPHIWVVSPEVGRHAGMPLEWASSDLKGVAAAAFRMIEDAGEKDCGLGAQRDSCKPVRECQLDLYFDRQQHPLPWAPKRAVADFDWQWLASAWHLFPAMGWAAAENGDVGRGNMKSPNYPSLSQRSPFADPQTGEELVFSFNVSSNQWFKRRLVLYDREIHSRYALLRFSGGGICGRGDYSHGSPNGQRVLLVKESSPTEKSPIYYEFFLPKAWLERVRIVVERAMAEEDALYQRVWKEINPVNPVNSTQGNKK